MKEPKKFTQAVLIGFTREFVSFSQRRSIILNRDLTIGNMNRSLRCDVKVV